MLSSAVPPVMAKFVLAGKTNCPYYAKAELLADYLQKNLPNFRVHKIAKHPDDWEQWLMDLCVKYGWKHKRSPIIWRELLDRGGKGSLLGGFNDFMEHAQEYYNVTSGMLSGVMKDIAAENAGAYNDLQNEEADIERLFSPLHVWITGASMPACYSLIPMLASGEVFGMKTDIWLHLLDNSHSENALQGLKMEAEDLASPCLRKVTLHTMADDAFLQADFVIVLDDVLAKGDQSPDNNIKLITEQCVHYGTRINQNAKKEVKVIVSGSTYTNLQALIILGNAPSINQRNIVALPTQLEFEAKAQIAKKLSINSSAVTDVIIWGNISGNNLLDLHQAKVYKLDSSIWGPSSFSRPLLTVIYDRNWIKNDLVAEWQRRRRHRSGLSAANAIAKVLSWWQRWSNTGEVVSLGVLNQGYFDLPGDIVFSVPVQFREGDWHVYTEATIQEDAKEILLQAASELMKEKNIALGIPQPQDEQTAEEESKENAITESELLSKEPSDKVSLLDGENQQTIHEPPNHINVT